jgi:hypothetical protein
MQAVTPAAKKAFDRRDRKGKPHRTQRKTAAIAKKKRRGRKRRLLPCLSPRPPRAVASRSPRLKAFASALFLLQFVLDAVGVTIHGEQHVVGRVQISD